MENACAAIVLTKSPATEGDATNKNACSNGLALTTHTDPSCDVKCKAGYNLGAKTIKCASDAVNGAKATGELTCTVSEGS